MIKHTLGVFAHVDAGKTTFCEQLLYQTQAIRTLGRVDHKSAFLDTHSIEKERGITIFAEQAYFEYAKSRFYVIDTPGHVDFSSEMARTLDVIDYALVLISGTDGIQSHTETILELLETAHIPTFFFINKLDTPHANVKACLASLATFVPGAVDFTGAYQSTLDLDFLERVAEKDESLLSAYFSLIDDPTLTAESISYRAFEKAMAQAISSRRVMPVFKGAALKGEGIADFLEGLYRCTSELSSFPKVHEDGAVSGFVYKIRYDHLLQRQTFIKLNSGVLRVRDCVNGERVSEIRLHQGPKFTSVQAVGAGDVFSIIGSKVLQVGDSFGDGMGVRDKTSNDASTNPKAKPKRIIHGLAPTLRSKMRFAQDVDLPALFQRVRMLEEEDPYLKVSSSINSREITIGIMGAIQLEVLKTLMLERFGFEVDFEDPQIVYKETIADEAVYGCGHFEPLRHYAEVHVRLSAMATGSGVSFVNACHADDLAINYVAQVKHCVLDTVHHGLLTGSELTDVQVTLMTGRGHLQHTATGDFYEATIRAIRHALEGAKNVLLEPLYAVAISVPNSLVGRIMTDLSAMNGNEIMVETLGETATIRCKVPVASFKSYATTLASVSSGKGRVRIQEGGYAPCNHPDAVIEAMGYEKDRDVTFPSSSVFCRHGKGYTVPWQEALEHMHCELKS